ncbi:ComF family protein [Acidisphaera sp. L21]|uniref:ComF family protein n=1 Tax=Acidisphaera sp. L21 TaxID=1641851 RepID=UPI0020B15C09|nr:ComF family protein [Acidisphaera sp. L21]
MPDLAAAFGLGRAALRHALRWGLDAVLPPQCLTCDMAVQAPGQMCSACFRATEFVTEPCCQQCGTPFSSAQQGGVAKRCDPCTQDSPPWRQGRAALRYDNQARRIILPLKHGDRVEMARALATHMARAGATLLREADVIVPVPLHRWRLLTRRYNQSALLCHELGRIAGRPVVADALVRTRATASLAGKTKRQRAQTVSGAFAVRPTRQARLAGQRVVLVDDVLTTGATATSCTVALLAGGAARVDLLVGARAIFDDILS